MAIGINIPDKLKIGFQKRADHKLAYIIYYDTTGKLRKEPSWQSWRDKSLEPIELDNVPTEGFFLSETRRRSRDWFGSGRSVWRVTHPNGFDFEISSNNLESIISCCDIIKGEIKEKCLFAWEGTTLSLIPINSELYTEAVDNTKMLKKELIKPSILKAGSKIKLQDGSIVTYLGKFGYYIDKNAFEDTDYEEVKTHWSYGGYRQVKGGYFNCLKTKKYSAPKHAYIEGDRLTVTGTLKVIEVVEEKDLVDEEIYKLLSEVPRRYNDEVLLLKENITVNSLFEYTTELFDYNKISNLNRVTIMELLVQKDRILLKERYFGYSINDSADCVGKDIYNITFSYKGSKFTY